MIRLTLVEQDLTTFANSPTTKSTHLIEGSSNLDICFLTIASKAISGVNRPTLHKRNKN